ncbi:MAG: DinB family protein [Gemmatimonadota bacterium]
MRLIQKPRPGEYPPYADMYLRLTPDDGRILEHLRSNFLATRDFIHTLPEERLLYRYALGKWSIKDILVHIIDDERIFAYRALRFARNEKLNLLGFDQDAYAREAEADARPLDAIFEEYEAVRHATIGLFSSLPERSLDRLGHGTGTANDATPRALVYHIAGHELHHLAMIRDRYL